MEQSAAMRVPLSIVDYVPDRVSLDSTRPPVKESSDKVPILILELHYAQ